MKIVIIIFYAVMLVVSGALAVASAIGNANLPWVWEPDRVAFSFVPMLVLTAIVLIAQYGYEKFSLDLLLQFSGVGLFLLLSSIFHMYPKERLLFSSLHLIAVVVFIIWNLVILYRGKY